MPGWVWALFSLDAVLLLVLTWVLGIRHRWRAGAKQPRFDVVRFATELYGVANLGTGQPTNVQLHVAQPPSCANDSRPSNRHANPKRGHASCSTHTSGRCDVAGARATNSPSHSKSGSRLDRWSRPR